MLAVARCAYAKLRPPRAYPAIAGSCCALKLHDVNKQIAFLGLATCHQFRKLALGLDLAGGGDDDNRAAACGLQRLQSPLNTHATPPAASWIDTPAAGCW